MGKSSTSFKKGQSGNPGGKAKDTEGVRELARSYVGKAWDVVFGVLDDKESSTPDLLRAAQMVFDRAVGRVGDPVDEGGDKFIPERLTLKLVEDPVDDETK